MGRQGGPKTNGVTDMFGQRTPFWLAGKGALGGHVQTIWPAYFADVQESGGLGRGHQRAKVHFHRERWDTPDGDFVDVDVLVAKPGQLAQTLLVMFHGLEGSSASLYAQAFARWAHAQGWDFVVPHFRGCSGEINRAPRTYHSGDHAEADWMLQRLAQRWVHARRYAVGISLGGNVLLRWAQEAQSQSGKTLHAIAAVCAPVDLAAAGHALARGINRHLYNRMFLNSLKPKALAKLKQHPGLFDAEALLAARDLYEYDQVFTAPLHGFASTEDYWSRCSAKPGLASMRDVPTLVLNARNDPFIPSSSLPRAQDVGPAVTLWQPAHGGHVGFATGRFPGHVGDLPKTVGSWLREHGLTAALNEES